MYWKAGLQCVTEAEEEFCDGCVGDVTLGGFGGEREGGSLAFCGWSCTGILRSPVAGDFEGVEALDEGFILVSGLGGRFGGCMGRAARHGVGGGPDDLGVGWRAASVTVVVGRGGRRGLGVGGGTVVATERCDAPERGDVALVVVMADVEGKVRGALLPRFLLAVKREVMN